MLHRKFIATILATSVAVTSLTAAPARAGNEDIAKVLLGATALVVIGSAIAQGAERDRTEVYRKAPQPRVVTHKHRYKAPARQRHSHAPARHHKVHGYAPRGVQHSRHRVVMPKACRINNSGRRAVYSSRCLQRYGY